MAPIRGEESTEDAKNMQKSSERPEEPTTPKNEASDQTGASRSRIRVPYDYGAPNYEDAENMQKSSERPEGPTTPKNEALNQTGACRSRIFVPGFPPL